MQVETKNNQNPPSCLLQVGTSGYSYAEWVEAGFYLAGTKSSEMLSAYAAVFSITELNYTWYQMPKAQAIAQMLKKVPSPFSFAVKLTRTMTHEIDPDRWRGQVALYREGVAPLIQSGQLAAILLQFPPFFTRTAKNRVYLSALLDTLSGMPLAVEFRHSSWADDRVFNGLEQRQVTLVTVDEPNLPGLFPPLDVVTNPDFFYIRFHGRNAGGWRSGNMQKQFDYDYTDAELCQWTDEKIVNMVARARKGYLFFNNHVRAQAPRNATMLIRELTQRGLI